MNISGYRIEPADYQADYDDLRTVRAAVFVEEQDIPVEIEFDAIDAQCRHVLARDAEHRPIGTGRLTADFKIGRMAVLPHWRGQGVGKALLQNLIETARRSGATEVTVNAPLETLDFYQKSGFTAYGQISEVAGIRHQSMRLCLQPAVAISYRTIKPRGVSVEAVKFDSLPETVAATLQLIAQARRQVCIYSRDLEYSLYGRSEIVEALKRFAVQSRDGGVQIVVQDTIAVRSQSHPLLDLAQRLPSFFEFRTPVEAEDLQYASVFLANDRDGYLFRLLGSRYEGDWSPAAPARTRQLAEEFDRIWQRSRICTEFRALGI
jgi:predicted GNAT family N-acyltransferase